MLRLLILFIFINMLTPFSFAMEPKYHSEGKEEEPESMEIVSSKGKRKAEEEPEEAEITLKKGKTPEAELSYLETLPAELNLAIANKLLDPLIEQLKIEKKKLLEAYPLPAHEFMEAERKLYSVPPLKPEDLKEIFIIIFNMVSIRNRIILTSKTLSEQFKEIIENKIIKAVKNLNPNIKNYLLEIAILSKKTDFVKLMLKTNANPYAKIYTTPKTGQVFLRTSIQTALASSTPSILKALINSGVKPPISKVEQEEERWLAWAILSKNIELVEYLLKTLRLNPNILYGKIVAFPSFEKNYPLLIAVFNEDINMVKLLLKYGAKVDGLLPESLIPLVYAAENKNKEMVKVLLEHGATPNPKVLITKQFIIFNPNTKQYEATPVTEPIYTKLTDSLGALVGKDNPENQKIIEIIRLLKQYGAKE
ncbi:ankyrin repeat domain-containing protein [Candidatus Dependentiae bacterium]|nr:ankyrin repeat domain-containing protein [Candidatus Dependentiae bacterium]